MESKFVRQSGGRGQYGHVCVRFEPADDPLDEGLQFKNSIVGGVIPKEYISRCVKRNRGANAEWCISWISDAWIKSDVV